jgi:hypothetical protein
MLPPQFPPASGFAPAPLLLELASVPPPLAPELPPLLPFELPPLLPFELPPPLELPLPFALSLPEPLPPLDAAASAELASEDGGVDPSRGS